MVAKNPSARVLISRIAAHEKWAATPDRPAATAPARQAFNARFTREARERYGDLPETQLAERALSLRQAYFARLALKSAEARRARAEGRAA